MSIAVLIRSRFLASLLLAALATSASAGEITLPAFSKVFAPDTIGPGSVSTLVFTIDNTNVLDPVDGLAFSDTMPAGMTLAAPAFVSSDCGGTVTAPDGGNTVSLTGGQVAAGAVCALVVNVTANAIASSDTA